jgi:hypothetical protein
VLQSSVNHSSERIVIVGGPRRGKSTIAEEFRRQGFAVRCGDPLSEVKEPIEGVEYLPEGLDFSGENGSSMWVAREWFWRPGPWVCEGHVMARALRRWMRHNGTGFRRDSAFPCDRVIVLDRPAVCEATRAQDSMHKGVMKVWRECEAYYLSIVEYG